MSTLTDLEKVIRRGEPSRPEARDALDQVMKRQLYRERGFGSCAEYCETIWGFNPNRDYQPARPNEVAIEVPAQVPVLAAVVLAPVTTSNSRPVPTKQSAVKIKSNLGAKLKPAAVIKRTKQKIESIQFDFPFVSAPTLNQKLGGVSP